MPLYLNVNDDDVCQPAYQAAYMMKIEINKKNQNKSDEATHVWMQMRKMRIIKENRAFGVTKNSGFPSAKSRRTLFGPHTCTELYRSVL